MTNAEIKALVAEREKLRQMLQSVDAELSSALRVWSFERGFLVKLTAEQALREMGREYA